MDAIISGSATDVVQAGNVLTIDVLAGTGAHVQRLLDGAVLEGQFVSTTTSFGPYLHDMTFRVTAQPASTVRATESKQTGSSVNSAEAMVVRQVFGSSALTLAQLTAITPTLGALYSVTDMGGAIFRGNGSRWAPLGGRCAIPGSVTTQTANFSTAAETVQVAIALTPGMWANGDFIDVRFKAVKVGASDTCAVLARFGTSPSTLGTSGQASTNLATTTQQLQAQWRFQRISATSISYAIGGAGVQATTTTAEPGAITVPNLDTQTVYLQLTMNKTVNTATEVAYFNYATAELVSFP